jgi:small subunit ribosomal protein S8e
VVFLEQYHKPHTKKVSSGSGGKKLKSHDKKLAHVGGIFAGTKVADEEYRITTRTRGGNTKQKLKKALYVNVVTKEGKIVKKKILRVVESHNPEFVRSNIITKGAIIETELGRVRVTNRVGQDGVVNGVQL